MCLGVTGDRAGHFTSFYVSFGQLSGDTHHQDSSLSACSSLETSQAELVLPFGHPVADWLIRCHNGFICSPSVDDIRGGKGKKAIEGSRGGRRVTFALFLGHVDTSWAYDSSRPGWLSF